ncbi:MAG: ISNCY family transposase [Bryobacteraceae bacterium]
MSVKELKRQEVLSRVKRKELGLADAAELMEVTYRHARRLWKRYRKEGAKGLVHRSTGRRSGRSKPQKFREKVLAKIAEKYGGSVGERFGPTLAAEHLASDDGLEVNPETLRRWMLEAGLWNRARKRKAHRQRRQRRRHFGELVQLDGSVHDWFEGRGRPCFLMNMVDDATGQTRAIFSEQETIWAAVGVLRSWVKKYGIPKALYTDWKNVYVKEPTPKQELRGEAPPTQFGRMCSNLEIRIIAANSPQAKGRVERNHGTHQDRLIKKMRLKGVSGLAEGNRFLPSYLGEHNSRFTIAPGEAEDYHTAVPKDLDLDSIFRLEETRTLGNDWVVSYKGRLLQVQPQGRNYAPAHSQVTVCEWEDGRIQLYYREQPMRWKEIPQRPAKIEPPTRSKVFVHRSRPKPPASGHPWKQKSFRDMIPRKRAVSRKIE